MASSQRAFVRRLRSVYGLEVRTRRDWGSTHGATYAWRMINRRAVVPADTVVEHVTVTLDPENATKAFDAAMRSLESIGMARFSSGVSYNIVIEQDTGMVGMGQPLRASGTHTVNHKGVPGFSYDQNKVARAIAWIANVGDRPSLECLEAHAKVIACLMDCGHITEDPDYMPHSAFTAKECPLESMRQEMPGILAHAKELHAKNKDVRTSRARRR